MPRKRTQPIPTMEPKPMPILKLDNVPGPEARADELATHYTRVQEVMACHRYDDVIAACHWCCDMEAGLAYTKPEAARGTARMFCSGRCASAFGAHRAKVHGLQAGKPSSTATGIAPPTDEETATQEETPVAKKRGSTAKATPTEELAEETGDEPAATVAATPESPSAWKPKGQRERKARKPRAAKPERNDGMCAKGLHEMTPENTYEYRGTIWCRACRAESRARSAAKRKA